MPGFGCEFCEVAYNCCGRETCAPWLCCVCNTRYRRPKRTGVYTTHVVESSSLCVSGERSFHLAGALCPAPRLAVVGSRAARGRFLRMCPPVIAAAKQSGWSLVSGGALGIDAAAHRAALGAALPQLAVLPCGPDRCYPLGNRNLIAEIIGRSASRSGVLFAHPPGTPTVRAMFASRNRIVVQLCEAVIVVQASRRSGSVLTGELARRQSVALAAVPGSDGCGELLRRGAFALPPASASPEIITHAVCAWLRGESESTPAPTPWPVHLQDIQKLFGPRGLDVEELDDPLAVVGELLEAETMGLIAEVGPGRYILTG